MKEGSCVATPFFTLFYQKIVDDGSTTDMMNTGRVAYIAGKKNGNAVWRNAAKRKLRAAWQLKEHEPSRYHVLLVAKKKITDHSARDIACALDELLLREGLLQ